MITDTELLLTQLSADSRITNEEIIKDMISDDVNSEAKQNMYYGCGYYKAKNTEILSRSFSYLSNGRNIEDEWRSNNKIPNGFLAVLVDQKVNYSLAKPLIISGADNCSNLIDINKLIRKMGKEASKKGVEWAHPYINSSGEFKVINISGQEIIPIYDTTFEQELLQVIRYYAITVKDNSSQEKKIRYKVELWDKEKVTYYMQELNSDNYYFDTDVDPNPRYHWTEQISMLGSVSVQGHGWGKVPFVPLWNNEEHITDLDRVKVHIDQYDKIESDFSNNIDDVQDAILKVVNYSGISDQLGEFLEMLKRYKVLPLDSEGDAQYMTMDIPIEAREKMLGILRDNIFEFGQGVDVNKVGDGNITNVVIKNRYAGLDLKANDFEARIKEFIEELFWFCNEYLRLTGQQQDDLKQLEVTFNRSVIINTKETIDSVVASKGIISDRTAISNHPWTVDVDEELTQMAADKAANMSMLDLDNPMPSEDETEPSESKTSTLNGAQVASLMQVVSQVAAGLISKAAAIEIITSAFGLSEEKANKILADAMK